jgi:uncharacterized protein YjbI with pentapeptide repeats
MMIEPPFGLNAIDRFVQPQPFTSTPERRKSIAFGIDGTVVDLGLIQLAKLQSIVLTIRTFVSDSTIVTFVPELDRTCLLLDGTESDIDRLQRLFDAGQFQELSTLLGTAVRAVEQVDAEQLDVISLNEERIKSLLVSAIKRQGAEGCDLTGVALCGVTLGGATLACANLTRANLIGADLIGADLRGSNLSHSNLIGANFSGANLSAANFSASDLTRSNLLRANLSRANLSDAILTGANFSEANLSNADVRGTILTRSNLSRVNACGAIWFGSNLRGANLSEANLSGANLRGSNLSEANLSEANLSEANLGGANVSGAIFSYSSGLTDAQEENLRSWGAIFDDFPAELISDDAVEPVVES